MEKEAEKNEKGEEEEKGEKSEEEGIIKKSSFFANEDNEKAF